MVRKRDSHIQRVTQQVDDPGRGGFRDQRITVTGVGEGVVHLEI